MPDLSLSYDFQHSPERMHTIMSEVENHDRFMPFCREGRIVSAQPGRRKFNVGYVLSSKKYGFTREFSAAFELKPETLNRRHPLPGAGCGRPRCYVPDRLRAGRGGGVAGNGRDRVRHPARRLAPCAAQAANRTQLSQGMEAMAARADDIEALGEPAPSSRFGTWPR